MEKTGNFLRGALVLSIAGALSKILGAIYRKIGRASCRERV